MCVCMRFCCCNCTSCLISWQLKKHVLSVDGSFCELQTSYGFYSLVSWKFLLMPAFNGSPLYWFHFVVLRLCDMSLNLILLTLSTSLGIMFT